MIADVGARQAAEQRLLITGAGGFVGRYVRSAVISGGFPGWTSVTTPPGWDLRDPVLVADMIERARPDAVIHLAAQSFVPRSFEAPVETFEVNLLGTLNLLQALRVHRFTGRLLYVSSADVFGLVPERELPVDESRWPEPRSPYGVSKVAAEQLCLQWHRSEGLDAIIARPFNHIGPGQDSRFVVPALASQVIAIAAGRQEPVIDVGDIDTTRDFTDVRDVVSAYAALLASGTSGQTYVIGSGRELAIRDLLSMMCRMAGIDPEVRQDPAKFRPAEQRRMVANPALIRKDVGWLAKMPIEQTLKDILEDLRKST